MEDKERLKLCVKCEGQINWDAEMCPFCGGDLTLVEEPQSIVDSEQKKESQKTFFNTSNSMSAEETLSSLYPPPYQPNMENKEENIEKEDEDEANQEEEELQDNDNNIFFTTLLLSLSVNLFLFGLFLFIFSKDNKVFLSFNSNLWFVYLLFSFFLFFFGYYKLMRSSK